MKKSVVRDSFKSAEIKILATFASIILVIGTIFYHSIESWSWIDSAYFSFITLLTIGYGDLYPTTSISKIFTIIFSFVGVGLIIILITSISTSIRIQKHEERQKKM